MDAHESPWAIKSSLEISNHFCPTKKTGTLTGAPHQPHARQYHRRQPTIPEQPLRLSPGEKHEQRPQ